jgi:hypothetical protein
LLDRLAADSAEIRLARAVAPDVHAGASAREIPLRARQLDPGHHLLFGTVTAKPGGGRVACCAVRELGSSGTQVCERRLERLELPALDLRPDADGDGPDRDYERWSIGT